MGFVARRATVAGIAPGTMSKSDIRINIVSGGHVVCLTCSAQLAEVPAACPVCFTPLVPGSFRLLKDAESAARRPAADVPSRRRTRSD
jgi:hypothetical protein